MDRSTTGIFCPTIDRYMATADYVELLKSNGIALKSLGLNAVALRRVDALHAVEILRDDGIPILGGDVYVMRGTRIDFAYANWHCDQGPQEAAIAYGGRTWSTAAQYIRAFPERPGEEPLFVIVLRR